MKGNYEMVDSRICEIPIIGTDHHIIGVDLSIVCQDEKYGLIHTSHSDGESELIVPCEYDNIYFTELWLNTYCVAVSGGKSGLFKIAGCRNGSVETAVAKQIIPCIYDKIGSCYPYHLLYGRKTVRWFDHDSGKTSAEYDSIVPLGYQYLLCTYDGESAVWDFMNGKFVFNIPGGCEIAALGYHGRNNIFKLINHTDRSEQLMFCSREGDEAKMSPKAERITVYFKQDTSQHIVGIQMSWGNMNDPLCESAIEMVTG